MPDNLVILAGEHAYRIIKDEGLNQERIKIMAGAAGGPKWLVLGGLDRAIITELFRGRKEPLQLIGSSIGSWRFAALAMKKPAAAIDRMEDAYTGQTYGKRATPGEVTHVSRNIIDQFIPAGREDEILKHPFIRLNVLTVRCRWPSSSEGRLTQRAGLSFAAAVNIIDRSLLNYQFQSVIFSDSRNERHIFTDRVFPSENIHLTAENLKTALLSSGSIPLVMNGVADISGAPFGIYRDGGMIYYHMDIPYGCGPGDIVLFPHYSNGIIPGWFDKYLPWRKGDRDNLKNILIVAPSGKFISGLPLQRIPDRDDFKRFRGKNDERIQYWKFIFQQAAGLGNEFLDSVTSGKIKDEVRPLYNFPV